MSTEPMALYQFRRYFAVYTIFSFDFIRMPRKHQQFSFFHVLYHLTKLSQWPFIATLSFITRNVNTLYLRVAEEQRRCPQQQYPGKCSRYIFRETITFRHYVSGTIIGHKINRKVFCYKSTWPHLFSTDELHFSDLGLPQNVTFFFFYYTAEITTLITRH